MALNYVIIVDDSGELKTLTAQEVDAGLSDLGFELFDSLLNHILDRKAIAAGEYTPEDDDTPIEVR